MFFSFLPPYPSSVHPHSNLFWSRHWHHLHALATGMWGARLLLGVQCDVLSFCLFWFGGWPQVCGLRFYFPGLVLHQVQGGRAAEADVEGVPPGHRERGGGPPRQCQQVRPDSLVPGVQHPGGLPRGGGPAGTAPPHSPDLPGALPGGETPRPRAGAGGPPRGPVAPAPGWKTATPLFLAELNRATWATPVPLLPSAPFLTSKDPILKPTKLSRHSHCWLRAGYLNTAGSLCPPSPRGGGGVQTDGLPCPWVHLVLACHYGVRPPCTVHTATEVWWRCLPLAFTPSEGELDHVFALRNQRC